ncbi:PQQ-dependent sugar dehydrogenase [Siminovitchia terrae]|uniref:Quinoprotein glucose dehydrogenase n=1 Tax=Siminovitchia terrae TaxID=1914933 RepID=A0A429XAX8_SIMTE|nr:PQQ-dependent sugar dehydrogenase [Siminovitchia terrae]RST60509.1 quinoprotein glucose dehydrogenase [Siminovitchia terrae]GIN91766.1 dehydrogenase [Siminovitchia terrae]
MKRFLLISLILFLSACSQSKSHKKQMDHSEEENQPASGMTIEARFADRLQTPWSITKKSSTFFISERNGTIAEVAVKSAKVKRDQVLLNKPLYTEGEGGLLGLELIPDTNVEALAYHTYLEDGKILNRLIRLQKDEDQWLETVALLEGIPGANIHNGGRIKIGPDHKVYVTTGDAAEPGLAQQLESLAGKILRLELDGSVPEDNPFAGSPIYSFGHRNPQGLAWDESGQLYATEHGQSAHDEINRIESGQNYGWPIIQGDEESHGMEPPLFHTKGNTWAPSGIAYHDGSLYISNLRGEAVRLFDLQQRKAEIFANGNGRIRDVIIEKGTLYFITNNTDGRGKPSANDDQLIGMSLE